MNRTEKRLGTFLFVLFILLGLYTFVQAQEKKPVEKPKTEDKLKLTDQESAALDGLVRESQQKGQKINAIEQELLPDTISDDKALLLVERWRKAKSALGETDTQLNSWWTAVKNRADCQDCTLNQQERRLVKPEKK